MEKKYKILIGIAILLITIRIILPYILLHYANKRLANMQGYYGHVDDLDLSLYRGAYKLKLLYLDKMDSVTKKRIKFFDVRLIDLSLEWKALFHGKLVGKLDFEYPTLRITKNKTGIAQVKQDTNDLRSLLNSFMPLRVNRLEVNHGNIHYLEPGNKPAIDIYMTETHVLAENLTNVVDSSKLPAKIHAKSLIASGTMTFDMRLNMLAVEPLFEIKAKVENTDLKKFNNFLLAYGKFDVNRGKFGLYMELAAADGKYIGYVKPVIKDLDVVGDKDYHKSFLHLVWEEVVGVAGVVFRNQPHDQLATKIPISGTFAKATPTDFWSAVAILLRNAFVQALIPSIDNEISLKSIKNPPPDEKKKGFFAKLFGSKKKTTKKK